MTTKGNIEMRVAGSILCASTPSDGYDIYKIIPMLADSFGGIKDYDTLKKWFRRSTRNILHNLSNTEPGLFRKEVLIDMDRRLILHNGDDEDYNIITMQTGSKFSDELNAAVNVLNKKYNFQVFNYRNWKLMNIGYIERKHGEQNGQD